MGIVASIVATPIAQAVAEDEARRELVKHLGSATNDVIILRERPKELHNWFYTFLG